MDDAVLEWIRVDAARRGSSVSRLVGEMLAEKMQLADAYERAARDWHTKDRLWQSDGADYPPRSLLPVPAP